MSDGRRNRDDAIALAEVAAGACASWGLWVAELVFVKGWAGLTWAREFNWSAIPISLITMTAASYLLAFRAPSKPRYAYVLGGSALAVAAFYVGKDACIALFSESMFGAAWMRPALLLALAWLLVAVGLPVLAQWSLRPIRMRAALLLGGGLILIAPLSVATIKLFPAFNASTDGLHAIKMGYPVFWAALIVPLALRLGAKPSRSA